jgi:diguanylate cyclase (GGDEF)-like protein
VLRRKVAVRLRSGLRASDVVASLGSDTFAVLLAWMVSPDDSMRVAAKLVQMLRRPYGIAGQELALAVSVGVARYPEQGRQAQVLLHQALAQANDAQPLGRAGDLAANDEG